MSGERTDRPGWAERMAGTVLDTPRRGPLTRIVAVEGRSGSGKSTVAERVRRALADRGEPVAVLTMEDLYPGWDGLAEAPGLLQQWVLEPLRRGRTAAWRRQDWERGAFGTEWVDLPPELAGREGTLLVEGCGSGAASVGDLLDLLVWVEAPVHKRYQRLDRRDDAEAYAPYRALWARQEDDLYARAHPRERADLRLDNTAG